ncbi:MAG: diacylglycerol kinase [Desulfuromonadales bacterium]
MKEEMKPSGWIQSVNCAIEGIIWAARSQRHMRYHFVAALVLLFLALFFQVTALEFILLAFAVTLVLFAEMINTALEVFVDLVSPQYHPLAGRVKDVAAGAVLIASIGAVVMGYLALSHYLFPVLGQGLSLLGHPPGELAVVSVLVVTILVVLLKALLGKGTPLHGGMPSGHAAISFSIATSIVLAQVGPVIALLTLGLAVMVSQSRLLLKIHTLREVVAGALLGAGVTWLLFWLFA